MIHNAHHQYRPEEYSMPSIDRLKDWDCSQALPRCVDRKMEKKGLVLPSCPREPRPPVAPVPPQQPEFDFANPKWSPRYPNDPAGNEGAFIYSQGHWGGESFGFQDPRWHWTREAFWVYANFLRIDMVAHQVRMGIYEDQMTLYNAQVKVYRIDLGRYRWDVKAYETKVHEAMKVRLFLSELGWGFLAVLWFLCKVIGVIIAVITVIGLILLLAGAFSKGPKADGNLEKHGVPNGAKAMITNRYGR